jgi:hypothetical protein
MRAVKAKRLRRRARELSVGMPERQLLGKEHKRFYDRGKVRQHYIFLEVFNDPKSTRGIYRALKKGTAA